MDIFAFGKDIYCPLWWLELLGKSNLLKHIVLLENLLFLYISIFPLDSSHAVFSWWMSQTFFRQLQNTLNPAATIATTSLIKISIIEFMHANTNIQAVLYAKEKNI